MSISLDLNMVLVGDISCGYNTCSRPYRASPRDQDQEGTGVPGTWILELVGSLPRKKQGGHLQMYNCSQSLSAVVLGVGLKGQFGKR